MFIFPVFDQIKNRPKRWSLQIVDTGEFIQYPKVEENRFVHWTGKSSPEYRDVYSISKYHSPADFSTIRKTQIGFLTTKHREFYEDGKFVEVWNDPVNYILNDPINYTEAFDHAEERIGNYRMGVRRYITHLGGTLSDDELDMLEDSSGTQLTSFPLFPPLPPTSFSKPFRTHLISSDIGYIDYIKTAHPDETGSSRYAYQSKQRTGYREFIFDANNSNMKYESDTINSVSKVDIKDLETITDAAINTATDGDATTFLPTDGEYVIYNIAANTVIRSDSISGISLEKWNGTSTLGSTLQAYINITSDGYIDITDVNGNNITMDNTSVTITDGSRTIVLDGSDIILTNGSRSITVGSTAVNVA